MHMYRYMYVCLCVTVYVCVCVCVCVYVSELCFSAQFVFGVHPTNAFTIHT
jgi:hypothetical protein